jgi:hypothetical protein
MELLTPKPWHLPTKRTKSKDNCPILTSVFTDGRLGIRWVFLDQDGITHVDQFRRIFHECGCRCVLEDDDQVHVKRKRFYCAPNKDTYWVHYLPIHHKEDCSLPTNKNARVTGDYAYRGPMFVCKHVFGNGTVEVAGHTELEWKPEAHALRAFRAFGHGPPFYHLLKVKQN